LFIHKQ